MVRIMEELLLLVSIFTGFILLNSIVTYKKEGRGRYKIYFCILIILTYTIARIFDVKELSNHISIIFYGLEFIIWWIYYRYFYNISFSRYTLTYCLFFMYYETFENILQRIIFIIVTGYSFSSRGGFLVSRIVNIEVAIYAHILMICIYIAIRIINKKFKFNLSNKKNYIYLTFALLINVVNTLLRHILGGYVIGENYTLTKALMIWRDSRPTLSHEWAYFDQFVIPKLIGISSIVIIFSIVQIIKDNKIKAQNEIIKNKLDMQYSHYLSIQESHMKVRKLYHDINNHIYCIDNLKNNSQEVNEYVNNLKDEIKEFKTIYNTGNIILDIIVDEKNKVCENMGIKFICDINFSKIDFIKPIDVSSIFANILDNAIEACEKIQDNEIEKYIRIKGTITKSYFVIKCENSKVNNIKLKKDILLTDKVDKFMHGIGFNSIKSSIQNYNGELLFEDEKDKFTLNIYIPIDL